MNKETGTLLTDAQVIARAKHTEQNNLDFVTLKPYDPSPLNNKLSYQKLDIYDGGAAVHVFTEEVPGPPPVTEKKRKK